LVSINPSRANRLAAGVEKMELAIGALLFGAGLTGGVANAIAGGGTLVTFPAMLIAGLPPVVANASNAVAVTPGHLVAAYADGNALLPIGRSSVAAGLATLLGGAAGAVLLLVTSERLFTLLVPALIGVATLIFAFARPIQRSIVQALGDTPGRRAAMRAGLLVPTATYGGYFGAGLGVMLLAVLAVTGREDARAANALKNLLATAVSAVTILIFTVQGMVRWPETLVMLTGATCGGYLGGRLVKVLPAPIVRAVVIAIGVDMTALYGQRYWL
jgi:uncharacterized protein